MSAGGETPEAILGPLMRDSASPLHSQISAAMRERIRTGEWPPHYKLHAEGDLAASLNVSRGTIRRALRTLIDEGLLQQVQGRGTFVTDVRTERNYVDPLRSMAEELRAQGIHYETKVLMFTCDAPEQTVARLLDLSPSEKAWRLERVRSGTDGKPLMFLRNWISKRECPALDGGALENKSLFDVLEHDKSIRIAMGRRTLNADLADHELARVLEVDEGAPLFYVQQITYTAGDRPLEYSDVWMPASRIAMTSIVRRGPKKTPPL